MHSQTPTDNALATRADLADVRCELRLVKWITGAYLATSAATMSMVAKLIFGH